MAQSAGVGFLLSLVSFGSLEMRENRSWCNLSGDACACLCLPRLYSTSALQLSAASSWLTPRERWELVSCQLSCSSHQPSARKKLEREEKDRRKFTTWNGGEFIQTNVILFCLCAFGKRNRMKLFVCSVDGRWEAGQEGHINDLWPVGS